MARLMFLSSHLHFEITMDLSLPLLKWLHTVQLEVLSFANCTIYLEL